MCHVRYCIIGLCLIVLTLGLMHVVRADEIKGSRALLLMEDPSQSIPENLLRLSRKNPDCEFLKKFIRNYSVFVEIYEGCGNQFEHGCGSYLFDGSSYEYCELMYEKQKLLYNMAKQSVAALEISVYMGHSAFIMLLANPDLKLTCIDVDDRYSDPALAILRRKFDADIIFIKGDSLVVLPSLNQTFDMFHLDGHHTAWNLYAEFKECIQKTSRSNVVFVIDDYDAYPHAIQHLFFDYHSTYKVIDWTIPNCAWRNFVAELLLN